MGENYRNTQNSSGCGYSDDWYTEVGVVTVMTGIQEFTERNGKENKTTNKQTTTTTTTTT